MIINLHNFFPCQCWHILPTLRAWLHLECKVVKSSTTAGPCGIPIPIFHIICLGFVHVHPGMGRLKSFRIRNTRLQRIPSTARGLCQDPPYWLGRALGQDIGWFLYGLYAQVREKIIQGLDPWAPMGWAYGAVFWQDYGRTAHVKWWTHRNLLLLVYFLVYLAFNKMIDGLRHFYLCTQRYKVRYQSGLSCQ